MESAFYTGSISAITLLVAMGLQCLLAPRTSLNRLFGVLFLLLASYLSLLAFDFGTTSPLLSFVIARFSSLIPAALWLVAFYSFGDRDRLPLWFWLATGAYVGLRTMGMALFDIGIVENSTEFYVVVIALPQLIMIALCAHAIYLGVAGFNIDLVEGRRRFRVVFITSTALFIVLTRIKSWMVYNGVIEGSSLAEVNSPLFYFNFILMAYALLLASWAFLSFYRSTGTLEELFCKFEPPAEISDLKEKRMSKTDLALVSQVKSKMEIEKFYLEPGLTVNEFAAEVGIHPHKLRRIICEQLKFGNFNQFLNRYRVQEAAIQLSDTQDSISTIALNVGFSSISSFNSAFKAIHGMTPSRFRARDSGSENHSPGIVKAGGA